MSTENKDPKKLEVTADHLPDRRVFILSDAAWNAFKAALNAPPKPNARLARLSSEPSVFD